MPDRTPDPSSANSGSDGHAGGITVTGAGRAAAVPTLFVARFAAQASMSRPSAAIDAASAALGRMRDAAVQRGASAEGLTTPNVSLRQDYDQQGRPHGFVAEISLTVRTADVADAGALLTACVEAGADQARLDSTSFEHAEPSVLLIAAREAAFGDAAARAGQLAALAGRSLGPVMSIEESPPGYAPMATRDAEVFAKASSVPTEPGSLDASVVLVVRWAWA